MPQLTSKNWRCGIAAPLAVNASKPLWAGVVRARPPHNHHFSGKIWCGQILPLCSKKEQENREILCTENYKLN
jgi:hypothetical protein